MKYDATTFLQAASDGDCATLRQILAEKNFAELCQDDESYTQAPIYAARFGQTEALELLLDAGADIETVDTIARTALGWAAFGGHCAMAKMLIKRNAKIDAADERGYTPFLWAAYGGFCDILEILADAGAYKNARNFFSENALMIASKHGFADIVRFLIDKKVLLNLTDRKGLTALQQAIEHNNSDVVDLLVNAKANLESQSLSCDQPLFIAIEKGNPRIVRSLVKGGADITAVSSQNHCQALHVAAIYGRSSCAEFLLDYIDIESQDNWHNTPLCLGVKKNKPDIVDLFIAHHANVNHRGENGCTPLIEATKLGNIPLMEKLLDAGADLSLTDDSGKDALDYARESRNEEAKDLLFFPQMNAAQRKEKRENLGTIILADVITEDGRITRLGREIAADCKIFTDFCRNSNIPYENKKQIFLALKANFSAAEKQKIIGMLAFEGAQAQAKITYEGDKTHDAR